MSKEIISMTNFNLKRCHQNIKQASLGQPLNKNTAVCLHLGHLPWYPHAELMDFLPGLSLHSVDVWSTATTSRMFMFTRLPPCQTERHPLPYPPICGRQPLRWSPTIPASWNSYPV